MARAEQFGSKGGQIANEWRSRVRGGGSAQPARHPDEGLAAAGAVGGEDDGAVALVLVDEARVRKVGEQRDSPWMRPYAISHTLSELKRSHLRKLNSS